MKNLSSVTNFRSAFYGLSSGFLALFSTLSVISCDKAGQDDGNPSDERLIPSVKIEAGTATETSISFTLIPENAASVRFMVLPSSEQAPDGAGIMASGIEAEASAEKEYTVDGLAPSAEFQIVAAAENSKGMISAVSSLKMKTEEHVPVVPSVTVTGVTVEGTAATVSYTLESAESVSFLICKASETAPDAEGIFAQGTAGDTDSGSFLAENLEYDTSYKVYAAAISIDQVYSEVSSYGFETGMAPAPELEVGDFYYSDGTFSSGSAETVPGKDVIGIVFKVGPAESDLSEYVRKGSGEPFGNVSAFVVGIDNISYTDPDDIFGTLATSFDWSGDFINAGTSAVEDDFSGFYNTGKIEEAAIERYGKFDYKKGWNCNAAYMASVIAEEQKPAPEDCSGWFMPSAGQLKELYAVKDAVNSSIAKAGGKALSGQYWSSSEVEGNSATVAYAYLVDFNATGEYVQQIRVDKFYDVRAVLAF